MNFCGIQQNGVASREEMMSFVSFSGGRNIDRKDSVVCPKPRRVGALNTTFNDSSRPPIRWHFGHHSEISDSRAGSELLDIILSKGVHGAERPSMPVASSPPFFCGSPPSRVSNPLIQDARFREEKQLIPPFSPLPSPSLIQITAPGSMSSPNSSSTRKGGCNRANFGNNPSVRVEGFDCLDRDSRNCSIPALA
ncbi:hypothetical protein SOVF_204780 [Spinacia oleracea]|uniref:Uncharacterized protein n=1 Tax=Spinacia oleracea TaxID=3562 RepID=A0A9R0J1C4_SPIOL|nr:uncharacterized protein LOC110798521 [Spinacia oleracea]KNA03895.1 hypothetical protein SOVF_204780 [Spinacia oleracea]